MGCLAPGELLSPRDRPSCDLHGTHLLRSSRHRGLSLRTRKRKLRPRPRLRFRLRRQHLPQRRQELRRLPRKGNQHPFPDNLLQCRDNLRLFLDNRPRRLDKHPPDSRQPWMVRHTPFDCVTSSNASTT